MKLHYVGKRQFKARLAEMEYSEKEERRFFDIVKYLEKECGWEIDTGVYGWAAVIVDDYDEYEYFKKDFQEAKKKIKQRETAICSYILISLCI